MGNDALNPYASPEGPASETHPRRPIGTVIFAGLLMLFGLELGAGGAIRFVQIVPHHLEFMTSRLFPGFVHLAVAIPLASITGAIGLLRGGRLGWWFAVLSCYFLTASFVVLPVVRNGISRLSMRLAVMVSILLVYWFYLNRHRVRAYFGHTEPLRWRVHLLLFAVCLVVVLGVGMC
ncbi:MAG: hypothetical protein GXX96_15015 [Planctomycetaceae bacterium]|nr:hypothetical protein [Planctomycetaceae bacterium]